MGRPWTRDDWNDLIRRVNALSCADGIPLTEVAVNHVWTTDDITAVRSRLTAICTNAPSFSADLRTWKQNIIEELNNAIDECECCHWDGPYSMSLSPVHVSDIPCWINPYLRGTRDSWYIDLSAPFGPTGIAHRFVRLTTTGTHHFIFDGQPPNYPAYQTITPYQYSIVLPIQNSGEVAGVDPSTHFQVAPDGFRYLGGADYYENVTVVALIGSANDMGPPYQGAYPDPHCI